MKNEFVISEYVSAFVANDSAGRRRRFITRPSSALIVTTSGRIRFSFDGGDVVSDSSHAVILPEGLTYYNECLESAESYVFNFHTLGEMSPMSLEFSDHSLAEHCYADITALSHDNSVSVRCASLASLYTIIGGVFGSSESTAPKNKLVGEAISIMSRNLSSPELTVGEIARRMNISEIYLRKLFDKHLSTTPFAKLREMRMARARLLVKEKRGLAEVSAAVGYSDVFQFSRAYKKHFGYPPSGEK